MQLKMHMVTIEDLVPKGHFLRKLESALDLSFVYEKRRSCTATVWQTALRSGGHGEISAGRISVWNSFRTANEQRIQTDMALRWYLGLDVFDRVPDHSTIPSCAGENRLFGKSFGGCLKKWWNNVSKKGWSVEDWWLRILPM